MLAEKNENKVSTLCCMETKISERTRDLNSGEIICIFVLKEVYLFLLASSNTKLKALYIYFKVNVCNLNEQHKHRALQLCKICFPAKNRTRLTF